MVVHTRRSWLLPLVGLIAISTSGCAGQAGAAATMAGGRVTESALAQRSAIVLAENVKGAPTDSQRAIVNRDQITYLIRHALLARAAAAAGIVVTDAEVHAAAPTLAQQNVTAALAIPKADEAGAIRDLLTLSALIKKVPAAGAPVDDVSVTLQGVPADTRAEAVAKRSEFSSNPASMAAALSAAADKGVDQTFTLLGQNQVAGAGVFRSGNSDMVLVPNGTTFLVMRILNRTVKPSKLTPAALSAATGVAPLFNLASLLLARYEDPAGISVNPRYGVWDPVSVQVVPGNDGL